MHLERLQNWAQNGPIANDKQAPFPWMLAAGVASNLAGAYLGSRAPKTESIGPNRIRKMMAPAQDVVNQMQGQYGTMSRMGQDLIDPNSNINQQQYQMMQQQGQNQLALQQLLARRQAASMGQDSGITQAQSRGAMAQTARNLGQDYQRALSQNRQVGIGTLGQAQGLLGRIGQMQTGISENIAQAAIAQNQRQREDELRRNQMLAEGITGIGSGLMGAWSSSLPTNTPTPTGFNMEQFMNRYAQEGMIWDPENNKYIEDPGN